ncbi:MAG: monofunctional biosynthetic peptidoglycan transglycosylase [Chitinophagia bacterium]|nr:monofunctional biosynthetic peptidoglycan transglycosylase [Chitinophagia bacterium]
MIRKILLWSFLMVVAMPVAYVLLLKWVDPPVTMTQLGSLFEGHGLRRDYVDFSEMSPNVRLAVMASEDQLFPDHAGFDFKSIQKAMDYNKRKPGRVRGASTISQQTAKNVFLWQGRSWVRKGFEVWFTFLIETLWSKQRILEVYLNVIEMGPCKFGVGAAAQDYFGVSASRLSREQAALIAACLPNPNKYSVSKPGPYMRRRQTQIARLMGLIGDGYFERYSKDTDSKVREEEERRVEKKLEEIPEETLLPQDEVLSTDDAEQSEKPVTEQTEPATEPTITDSLPN